MSLYYMFNKPRGFITASRDDYRPTIMEFFPPPLREVLHPVGRLDMDTEGFIIMTDDGRLDNSLSQPSRHVKKEYFFYALGDITPDAMKKLNDGIEIFGTSITSKPAEVRVAGHTTVADIEQYLPAIRARHYMKNPDYEVVSAYISITEGKKHQVRLMMRSAGCMVVYLKRTAIGGIKLDDSLPAGGYRPLSDDEIRILIQYKNT